MILISTAMNASVYEIYKSGGEVVLRDKYSNRTLKESSRAGDVLQYGLELLGGNNGGKLDIGPGEFLVDRMLTVGDNISLTGQGRFTKLVFSGAFEMAVSVKDRMDVEISDLIILCRDQSVASGIVVDNSGSCVVSDAKIIGFSKYGVVFKNNTFVSRIEKCELAGNQVANVYFEMLDRHGRLGDFIPNTISNCMFVGGGKGIEMNNAVVTTIVSNTFTQCLDHAMHIHTHSNAAAINGNHTFQIDGHSLLIEDFAYEMSISGNMFSWHSGSALVVRNSCWGSVTGNLFIDNGFSPDAYNFTKVFKEYEGEYELRDAVILEDVTGYTVNGNTIYNWQVAPPLRNGIVEDSLSYRNIISNNIINYFEDQAVDSKGRETIVKDNNSRGDIPYHWFVTQDKDSVRFDFDPSRDHIQSWLRNRAKEYVEKY